MSLIKIQGNPSGTGAFTIAAPNGNTDRTLTLPDATGTVNVSGLANEVPAGSAGAPAIYPTGDSNTGVFFPAADTVGFSAGGTERVRITSGGYFKASNNGAYVNAGAVYHELKQSATNTNIAILTSSAASPYGPNIVFDSATPNNTTNYFLECGDATNIKASLYSNGSWQVRANSYGGISDLKLKQDIVDANSQWDDIKGLRIRKYRFKDEAAVDPDHPLHLGVIAQEAELVSPGLVFESPDFENVEVPVLDDDGSPVLNEDGTPQVETKREPTGTVTKGVKYSILYMKAVKALQEAMARIETLEAEVAALKGASA